jgi:hypothetical protein
MPELTDRKIVEEMWTIARNEPLTLSSIVPFGFVDRDRYRRRVGEVVLEFTLDSDPRTKVWSYELAILDATGATLDGEIVEYWLQAFFGRESFFAARRNFELTGEARYTFPYRSSTASM